MNVFGEPGHPRVDGKKAEDALGRCTGDVRVPAGIGAGRAQDTLTRVDWAGPRFADGDKVRVPDSQVLRYSRHGPGVGRQATSRRSPGLPEANET